jgi:hypothetical protein
MSARLSQHQRELRTAAKRTLARAIDHLATREQRDRQRCVLGGLQSVACRAGCSGEWVAAHIYPMAARHPEIVLYGRGGAAA